MRNIFPGMHINHIKGMSVIIIAFGEYVCGIFPRQTACGRSAGEGFRYAIFISAGEYFIEKGVRIMGEFILNVIHRPEMVPEYSATVTGHGKEEDC